jgi:hypothetical protein
MRITISIPRPAGCPCCAAEDAADALKLKAFIERVKNVIGEKAKIEVVFDSSDDTPSVSIDGKRVSSGRYPDSDELSGFLI